jgi:hypothetical protein
VVISVIKFEFLRVWAKIFCGSYIFGIFGSFAGWVNRNLELFGGN